jgi:hypothetical protein
VRAASVIEAAVKFEIPALRQKRLVPIKRGRGHVEAVGADDHAAFANCDQKTAGLAPERDLAGHRRQQPLQPLIAAFIFVVFGQPLGDRIEPFALGGGLVLLAAADCRVISLERGARLLHQAGLVLGEVAADPVQPLGMARRRHKVEPRLQSRGVEIGFHGVSIAEALIGLSLIRQRVTLRPGDARFRL